MENLIFYAVTVTCNKSLNLVVTNLFGCLFTNSFFMILIIFITEREIVTHVAYFNLV